MYSSWAVRFSSGFIFQSCLIFAFWFDVNCYGGSEFCFTTTTVENFEDAFTAQGAVHRHYINPAKVARLARLNGLLSAFLLGDLRQLEDVAPGLVDNHIFRTIDFNLPVKACD